MDKLDYSLFTWDWSAVDELQLLKGISISGIDNWVEMAEMLGNKKSGDECASHFYSFYFKSKEDPIPCIRDVIAWGRDASTFKIDMKSDEENVAKERTYIEEISEEQKKAISKQNKESATQEKKENES